jgi:hypothetical protein
VPPETSARERDRGDPGAAPRRAVWSDQPRWAGSGVTRLVIELADLPAIPHASSRAMVVRAGVQGAEVGEPAHVEHDGLAVDHEMLLAGP